MRKTAVIVAFVALASAGAVAYYYFGNSDKPAYITEKAARGDVRSVITATGTVNAVRMVQVGTQVSGAIKELFADFNSIVRKGQLIALIDPASFEVQVEQAEASLMLAQANIAKAEAALADSERGFTRALELYERTLISKSEFEDAETDKAIAGAQLGASKAELAKADASLKAAKTNLGYTRIVSPVSGIVVSRNIDIGQTVAASFQTPTLFSIAEDLKNMQINASVGEADIGRTRVGQEVEFTVDAYPERIFSGKVSQVRNSPVTVQNVVTYDVIILVGNPESLLKPGMTANVTMIDAERKDVLKIPNSALRFIPQSYVAETAGNSSNAKGPGVWIEDAGTPRRVQVSLGISDGTSSEVVSGDLSEGASVIVGISSNNNTGSAQTRMPRMF